MIEQRFSVPCVPFNLRLSVWDCVFPPMYSKRLLFFPLGQEITSTDGSGRQQIVQWLHDALRLTVDQIPWLAGTVVPIEGTPWRYEAVPRGEAVLDVRDYSERLSYQTLKAKDFSCATLDTNDLCPLPDFLYPADAPVCRIRASFIDGGLILTFQVSHILCDGFGIMLLLRTYADNFCTVQSGNMNTSDTITPNLSLDRRSTLNSNGVKGDISQHPAWTLTPLKAGTRPAPSSKTTCASYRISASALQQLKSVASPVDSVTGKQSAHDAVAALMWRALMLARHRAGIIASTSQTVYMATAVDCRAKLGLPAPYHGNAIYAVRPGIELRTLISGPVAHEGRVGEEVKEDDGVAGLQAAACMLRNAIDGVTADTFRQVLACVERTETEARTRLAGVEDSATCSMLLISWFRYPVHELRFGERDAGGLGTVEAYRLPFNYVNPGSPTVLPGLRGGKGDEAGKDETACEFVFNEPDAVIGWMAQDALFTKFAERTS